MSQSGAYLKGGLHHHSSTEAKHQVKGALLLDVVVSQGAAILELLSGEDQTLLVRGDSLLVLDLSLDVLNGVVRLHLEGDSLTGQGLHEDLHFAVLVLFVCVCVFVVIKWVRGERHNTGGYREASFLSCLPLPFLFAPHVAPLFFSHFYLLFCCLLCGMLW